MLSETEKRECQQILLLLTDKDVLSLVQTITHCAVKADSRSEAENAVLSFSDSAEELLNRRKITREVLMNYCFRASIPVSAEANKSDLIRVIIARWNPSFTQVKAAVGQISPVFAAPRFVHQSALVQPAQPVIIQNYVNYSPVYQTNTVSVGSCQEDTSRNQKSAEVFVKWFYEMLNSCNPAATKVNEDFGPQHFWNNAKLFLVISAPASKEEEEVVGSDKVSQRLILFPKTAQILFNPNISIQGVAVKSTNHGAKLISVCGTLHKTHECVGIFQQAFALVSDPMHPESWKISVTSLKMDQCSASTLPKIQDCVEMSAIESHTARVQEQLTITWNS